MGIRETLNKKKSLGLVAGAVLIIVALGFLALQMLGGGSDVVVLPPKAYFATDLASADAAAKSLFATDRDQTSPSQKDGKPAYRARVYSNDAGKTKVVVYFERLTPEAKARVDKMVGLMKAAGKSQDFIDSMVHEDLITNGGLEYRLPEADRWIPSDTARPEITKRLAKLNGDEVYP